MSCNKVFLIGNLCADVEVRSVGSTTVGKIRLAVDESFTSKSGEKVEKTVYVDVDAWERLANNCAKMIGKGCSVMVEGKLQMDEWEDKATGQKRNKLKVRADRIEFLSFKDGGKGNSPAVPTEEGEGNTSKAPGMVQDSPFNDDPPF